MPQDKTHATAEGNVLRMYRPTMVALSAILLGIGIANLVIQLRLAHGQVGLDLQLFESLGRRWLETGSLYSKAQLSGPYSTVATSDPALTPGLYPPPMGPVFAALTFLPWPLLVMAWWALPIAVLGFAIRRLRPAPWSWPLMAACLAWPEWAIWNGGTSFLAAAAVAGGLLWGWPAGFILLKPTLLPFALIGVRSRAWWLLAGAIAVLTLVGPWRDYFVVVANASDGGGIWYSLNQVPLLLLPLFAWLGRRQPGPALTGTPEHKLHGATV